MTTYPIVPYQPTPLLMLRERIRAEIARHKAELKRLQERERMTVKWEVEDRCWAIISRSYR